jgi:hypothetical protein
MMPSPLVTQTPIPATSVARPLAQTVQDLRAAAGTTIEIPFTATYAADGGPVDLTAPGMVVRCLVKAHRYDADAAARATLTTGDGVTLTDGVDGLGTATVPPATTSDVLGYAAYLYTVRVIAGDDSVWDIQTGTLALTAGAVDATS